MVRTPSNGISRLKQVLCGLALVVGSSCLVGWLVSSSALKAFVPGSTPMNPLTAICFISLATGVLLDGSGVRGRLTTALGVATLVSAFTCLLRIVAGIDLGLDQLLFRAALETEAVPNRMAPNTATAMIAASLALIVRNRSFASWRPAEPLAVVSSLLGLLTVTGYWYSAVGVTRIAAHIPMAFNTALMFLAVSTALLLLRPNEGVMQLVTSRRDSGRLARRLLGAAIVVPLGFGVLRLQGQRMGLYDTEFGAALHVMATIVVLSGLVLLCVTSLDRNEKARSDLAESARVAGEQARKANEAKSEFLSRMSHELRTPLNSILGFGQLLLSRDLKERDREAVQHIVKGGKHLLGLINEVLDITRIEMGRIAVSREPVNLRQVVDQALEMVGPVANERKVELAAQPYDPDIYVFADRQRLLQVLLNLLSNAVNYNKLGGSVLIEVRGNPSQVSVHVRDTGIGIAEADAHKLFVPFERLRAPESGVEGTGLGLALSKRLCEAMQGTLALASSSENGSEFVVELARAESPMEQAKSGIVLRTPSRPAAGGSWKALYIEDNLANVALLEQIAESRGDLTLVHAATGEQGLATAARERPHIILLDLHLPGMHGLDVLKKLKATPDLADVPVVVLSADATGQTIRRLIRAGAHSYLPKPLDLPTLHEVFDEIFYSEERNIA